MTEKYIAGTLFQQAKQIDLQRAQAAVIATAKEWAIVDIAIKSAVNKAEENLLKAIHDLVNLERKSKMTLTPEQRRRFKADMDRGNAVLQELEAAADDLLTIADVRMKETKNG